MQRARRHCVHLGSHFTKQVTLFDFKDGFKLKLNGKFVDVVILTVKKDASYKVRWKHKFSHIVDSSQ